MSARDVIALVSFLLAVSGAVIGNMFTLMMVGEINRKKPEGELISYFGYHLGKTLRIFREYRQLYPDGKLHIFACASGVLMFAGMIGFATLIGFLD